MMKNRMHWLRKTVCVLLCFILVIACLPVTIFASGSALSDDIVILYTNDVHTYVDGNLSYDVISAIKKDLQTEYKYVYLVDAGDHIQGTVYGAMDNGKSIIEMMNCAGYDVATLGNHEFDYNMQGCKDAMAWADFPYVSCNFYNEVNETRTTNVLDSYVIFDCGEEKLAFVGITTPESFTKSTPKYFQDNDGNFIYGISGGENGEAMQEDVQNAINSAVSDGATKVIALGHLGVDPSSEPWTSEETIRNVSGLSAFIDGHSHTVVEGKNITDKDGNNVILTQTGEYFNRIGIMVIEAETGNITTDFIEYNSETGKLSSDLYSETEVISDTEVKVLKDNLLREIDSTLGQKIGFSSVTFDNYDEDGNRLVRKTETNSGDLSADSLYYLFDNMDLDVDVAVMNGGGVRNTSVTGDITYKTCKNILPFGNVACLQTVTGQQILDMLEWSSRSIGTEAENGSLLHVSGIKYKVDVSVPDTIPTTDLDEWNGVPEKYRVYDVKVFNKENNTWDNLDTTEKYNLAGYNYTLRNGGGGYKMLENSLNVVDYVMEDYMVIANYVQAFENGTIEAANSPINKKYSNFNIDYSSTYGDGRIETVANTDIYIGGVRINDKNASDIFGDGTASYDAETNTLTLNGYTCENEGYLYSENSSGKFYAAIYSKSSLNINLVGINRLMPYSDSNSYGDGIVVNGDLNINGDGEIIIESSIGISVSNKLTISDCTIDIEADDQGVAGFDDLIVNDAKFLVSCSNVGVRCGGDIIITDSYVYITVKKDCLYAYGKIIIACTDVTVAKNRPSLEGAYLKLKSEEDIAIVSFDSISISENLTIITDNAEILQKYDDDSGLYYTSVFSDDETVKELNIKPLGYNVRFYGLKNTKKAIVPAGKSLNESYCSNYGVDDFSQIFKTEKEGYTFGGWYTDEQCTDGNEYSFNTPVTSDLTLYAKWVPVQADEIPDENEENNTDNTEIPDTNYSNQTVFNAVLVSAFGLIVAAKSISKKNKKGIN